MPSICCVPCCFSSSRKYTSLHFFRFPVGCRERNLWKRLARLVNVTDSSLVCSLHFVDGVKTYINHTPVIFPWSSNWENVLKTYNDKCDSQRHLSNDHTYMKCPAINHDDITAEIATSSRRPPKSWHLADKVGLSYIMASVYFWGMDAGLDMSLFKHLHKLSIRIMGGRFFRLK